MPSLCRHSSARHFLAGVLLVGFFVHGGKSLVAQGVPTVQQSEFRSQWVGEQVDQIPLGGSITPLNGLGAVVGSLQTPDEVQREVDASMSGVQAKSPFAFKPSLGLGWQTSNQGSLTTNSAGVNTFAPASSVFLAPAGAVLYDREHGPWSISAGYSAGYKYYLNPNYTGNGTANQRNPFSQTALFKSILEMSRYIFDSLITASVGTGYDTTSGSNNQQTAASANMGMKYLVSSQSAIGAKAGYSFQNFSGSVATPNNNTTALFATVAPVYFLSDKTHISTVFGAGRNTQSLQSSTTAPGDAPTTSTQIVSRQYSQALAKVKYDFSAKLVADAALGARYITSSNIQGAIDDGLRPAWALGVAYTPTAKTSVTLSTGMQGTDIQPELNLLVNWQPRQKTGFSFGVSQSQQFANTLTSQYLISRSIIGSMNQQFFTSVMMNLSLGYTTQSFVNLSDDSGQSSSQLPQNFYIANAALNWKIRDWVSLANTLSINSGQNQIGSGANNQPQWVYSISLNFAL